MTRFIFVVFVLLPYLSSGQGENNIWVNTPFNNNSFCIIDFNNGEPDIYPVEVDDNPPIVYFGSNASICDKEGNLLFYVNNHLIYTRLHQIMPHNFGTTGLDNLYAAKYFIVKRPGSGSQYYVIQYLNSLGKAARLSYCIVDMDLNGGMGDVIPGFSDIVIDNSKLDISSYGSSIAVVKGNCDEYWLTNLYQSVAVEGDEKVEGFKGRFFYAAYHITAAGISTEPVIKNFGLSHNYVTTLAISSRLGRAFIHSDRIYMYDFDKASGYLSGERVVIRSDGYRNHSESLPMQFDLSEENLIIPISINRGSGDSIALRGSYDLYNLNVSDTNIHHIQNSFRKLLSIDSCDIISTKVGPDNNYYFHCRNGRFARLERQSADVVTVDWDLPRSGLNFMGYFPTDNAAWFKGDIFNSSQIAMVCHPEDRVRLNGYAEASSYLWSTGETTSAISGSLGNTYWVRSEVCGALYCDTFVVMLRPDSLSEGISPMETEVCSGALLTFTSNGDHTATYLWRNERGQILGTEASIQSNVYYPGKVYLDETTRDGCTYTDSVTFTTYPCCDLLVPNSFSPNGDGLNDAFGIVAEADKRIELLHIYNRYGQLVYKSTEMYDRWDGTYLGAPLPAGVYYYVLQYRCYSADESLHTRKGDITLMR